VLSLPDFARGNGQSIDLASTLMNGLPVRLSDGAGVNALAFTLRYAPRGMVERDAFVLESVELAPALAAAGAVLTMAEHCRWRGRRTLR
jgi:hypothetical protein